MLDAPSSLGRLKAVAVFAAAVALSSGSVAGADAPLRGRLSGLAPMRLHAGVTIVPGFAGDGRAARVVEAWRDNGNAHGYRLYVVLLPTRPGGTDWNVVGVDGADGFEDTIRDDPHTGEDVVRSVVFAKGRLDGRRATLLITATRQWKGSIPEPAVTEIRAYVLRHNAGDVGETQDYFEPVGTTLTKGKYCHADKALNAEFGWPLSAAYAGGNTKTGC